MVLKIQSIKTEKEDRNKELDQGDKKIFSLEDLFNSSSENFVGNVYEVITNYKTQLTNSCTDIDVTFKFVQIHKKVVVTSFSKHEVL